MGEQEPIVPFPSFYSGRFKEDMRRALIEVGVLVYKGFGPKKYKNA